MEGGRVRRLKRTVRPVPANFFLCLFTTALLLAMTPFVAMASSQQVYATDPGDYFDPEEVFINVGDIVAWTRENPTVNIHNVIADSTQGDYRGNKCYEPGGLNGYIYQVNIFYNHQFSVAQDCYYRCTFHPPDPATGYPGMQGVIHVMNLGGSTTTTTRPTTTTTTTTTTLPNQAPSAVSLTPVNIATLPSVAQTFTAVYSDPDGYQNITDTILFLSGITHDEWAHYSPLTNKFTMMGVGGNCSPGQATTLSSGFLTLNCGSSSASGSGSMWTVVYNLTPQPPLSGTAYQLIISVTDQGSLSNNKTTGTWTVNRPPSADSVSPMNSSTPPGTVQIFTAGYSDPDGWQNIAAANFYLSGNGGAHIEWLHYLVAPNLFTMLGTNDVCSPGQAITISNGFLSLDCGASSISGSGTVLTVTFRLTPQAPSSGIQYLIFTAASDQAGAAHAIFAGNWGIQ